MNKRTPISLSTIGFIFGCLSGVFSYLFFRRITLEAVVIPFVILLLGVSASFLKEDKKRISWISFIVSVLILLFERGYLSYVIHGADIRDCVVYIVMGIIPFTLYIPLYIKTNNKGVYVFLILIAAGILLQPLLEYTVRYMYLYEYTYSYDGSKRAYIIGSMSILVAILSKVIFDTKRNYLTYVCILLSGISFGVDNALRFNNYSDIVEILKGMMSSSMFFLMIFSFIIYCFMETTREKEYEKRNIIFKDIVYQELKPIKKRKRVITFEVPPNVPKFRYDLTNKKESDNKNNKQND